jgi:predicted NAD-dependent protein-ADP-ribosyltransferase YbiA (DUF1768 family)
LLGQQFHAQFSFFEWDNRRSKVYEEAVLLKFEQNDELAKQLILTGEKKIVSID